MCRTHRQVVKSKPRHANAHPYQRTEKHKPPYGTYPNAEFEENNNRW